MAYNYIERYYGTRFEPGMRVLLTVSKNRPGVVRGVRNDPQYVKVLFDDGHIGDCHPDELAIVLPEKKD